MRDGEKSLPLDADGENRLLLDAGRRNPTAARRRTERNQHCWSRDGEKLLLLDAGPREITAADFQTERNYCCLLDEIWREQVAGRRVTAAARWKSMLRDGAARNHSCWTRGIARHHCVLGQRDGEKLLLRRETALNNCCWDLAARNHCYWTKDGGNHCCWTGETHCCWTPNGEKPLAGRRETDAARRGTARNHCC